MELLLFVPLTSSVLGFGWQNDFNWVFVTYAPDQGDLCYVSLVREERCKPFILKCSWVRR